ncbi:hypothetical protein E1265_20920 [Streptomyces sp. 8K308]|uniref:hypothetical protein n=1 Tax=Streptomyces sp. 8K308 TaxID=2530388 RepID=UPI001052F23D|nr:hypothetical protein [Streptomyces sp. 8K308]TDC20700.1 hypothetical protein E1265_20920 [Streptomyces sp. 8K308]
MVHYWAGEREGKKPVSGDGLYYIPDGFRESARGSFETADLAESTRRYLDRAVPNPNSYADGGHFAGKVDATRLEQMGGVARAAEGRENMAGRDHVVADTGDEMEIGAEAAINTAASSVESRNSPIFRGISDAV